MITDRVIFVCTLILAAVYFYATAQIPSLEIGDPLGPKAFPRMLGIGLLITAGMLFMEMWKAKKAQGSKSATAEEPRDYHHYFIVAAVVVWTGLYFAVFEWLGYILSTAVFLTVLTAYFNRGKWTANVLTSVLFSIGGYVMFSKLLEVNLPRGILPF
ncbi:MAG TPA: tripartite tricarboxylate transporter TctB family protein [Burkholderiales bacterium]|nr:tripartite tricarboxylate transporter TctB family protein [Burkholderiales bacterium]